MTKNNPIIHFIKKEVVLVVAWVLAIISACFVLPDAKYISYIDYRTLGILFGLMCVMAGLRRIGAFDWIAQKMLTKVKGSKQLVLTLVLLCFFSSMFITNDVALITFVPFTFTVLKLLPEKAGNQLMIPTVVLQTIAANLGSMLTPIGNPQNLYLYGKAGISLPDFLMLMLPYTVLALVILVAWSLMTGPKESDWNITFPKGVSLEGKTISLMVYGVLFVLCILVVAHVLPYQLVVVIVAAVVFLMDRPVFAMVDYSLLATFVGFFIFIGNMGRIPVFCDFLAGVLEGNEVLTAVISSQAISNVPAALLLSGFTENYEALIIGTNLGGLGTLIASMASLISYKYVAVERPEDKGRYFKFFTISNIAFLIAEIILWWIL